MSTILAHLRVKPGAEARFEEIARRLYASTHELETGVLRYEYWRGAEPRTYYTLLSFDDHRTFIAAEKVRSYTRRFAAEVAPWWTAQRASARQEQERDPS